MAVLMLVRWQFVIGTLGVVVFCRPVAGGFRVAQDSPYPSVGTRDGREDKKWASTGPFTLCVAEVYGN